MIRRAVFSNGLCALLLLAALLAVPGHARAELHIDITRGKVEPMQIAVPVFSSQNSQPAQNAADITA